jgi:CHAT domain-containing protein
MGDVARGEALLLKSRDNAAFRHDDYDLTTTLVNLALLYSKVGRFDECIRYGQLGAEAGERVRARRSISAAYGNTSACLAALGEIGAAQELNDKAVRIQAELGDSRMLSQSMGRMGTIRLMRNDAPEAVKNYLQAYQLARAVAPDDASVWAVNLSVAYLLLQNVEEAERWNDAARRMKTAAGDENSIIFVDLNAADIAAARGQVENARQRLENLVENKKNRASVRWSAYASLGRLASQAGHYEEADKHFQSALDLINTRRSEFEGTVYKISFLASLINFYQQYVDALMTRGDGRLALRVAESSRARDLTGGGRPVEEIQAASRRLNATLVSYWVAPKQSWMWVVTASDIQWKKLPGQVELERLVEAHRDAVEKNNRDPLTTEASRQLASLLLEPLRGHANVIVVPDGALARMNLETLPVNGKYWIEQATVSVTPSLSLLAVGPAAKSRAPQALLAVGDAEETDSRYPKLRFARQEINDLAGKWPSADVLTGEAATPEAYESAHPEQFRLIHFAAHAEANPQDPLTSAIILSPAHDRYRLLVRDVAAHPLRADLVTISGCRSAGVRAYSGEGLIGFAWGFLRAGARAVVAGLWKVNDESTADLMSAMYRGLAAGRPPTKALHDAKLELLHSASWSRPYYWAPFQIYVQ